MKNKKIGENEIYYSLKIIVIQSIWISVAQWSTYDIGSTFPNCSFVYFRGNDRQNSPIHWIIPQMPSSAKAA